MEKSTWTGLTFILWTVTISSFLMILYANVGLDDHFASEPTSVNFASAPFFKECNGFAHNSEDLM